MTVDQFLRDLEHPLKPAIELLRTTVLSVHSDVGEEIKWNAPSFFLADHFATINLGRKTKARPDDHIMLILHRGARAKAPKAKPSIADPDGLLQWLGTDRAALTFHTLADVKQRQRALKAVLKQWIDAG
jgi:hypothetical protein